MLLTTEPVINTQTSTPPKKPRAAQKRAEYYAAIAIEGLLTAKIATRKLSAVQVLKAFAKWAVIAQQLVKCCTELIFEEVLERARALDEHLERTGSVIGDLHGLPGSLEDMFDIKGFDSTIGWVGLIKKLVKESSVLTDVQIAQGIPPIERAGWAVIDCLTAAGHTLIEWDPTSHAEAYKDWVAATFADDGDFHRKLSEASGEPLVKGLLVGTEKDILSVAESRDVSELKHGWHAPPRINEIVQLAAKKLRYEKDYFKRWNEAGIDALITTVAPWFGIRPRV
ncbi:acetamidase [Colletotrichum acutatum]